MDDLLSNDAYDLEDSGSERLKKPDIGRIGENIVTNEFIWRGFLVTHLDKGTRGVSANADLMVMHPKNRKKPLLVQVKSCLTKGEPNWVFVGNITDEIIRGCDRMYNSKDGFHADILAVIAVSITAPRPTNYRILIIPIDRAEKIIVNGFREYYAQKLKSGEARKVYSNAFISLSTERDSKSVKFLALRETARKLLKYEDAFDRLIV
jgi:hypothetical protein